jgi:hypothetical protein
MKIVEYLKKKESNIKTVKGGRGGTNKFYK